MPLHFWKSIFFDFFLFNFIAFIFYVYFLFFLKKADLKSNAHKNPHGKKNFDSPLLTKNPTECKPPLIDLFLHGVNNAAQDFKTILLTKKPNKLLSSTKSFS